MSRLFLPVVALLLAALPAGAHQPYESSAVAQLDGDRLELTLTTSAEIARQLAAAPVEAEVALETYRPQMLALGAHLYEVAEGGQVLGPERTFFSTRNGEAVFSAVYPLRRGAKLRLRAAYLGLLPGQYSGSLQIVDEAGRVLGRQQRLKKGASGDVMNVMVAATAASPTPEPAPTASEALGSTPGTKTAPSPADRGEAAPPAPPGGPLLAWAWLALLLAGGGAWWLRRRPRPTGTHRQ